MAKFTIPALLLLALSGSSSFLASAQTYNTSDPFTLQLTSDNETIAGQVLGACHAGAAIEELCLGGTDATATTSNTFYLNVSSTAVVPDGQLETGVLVWVLHGGNFNLSEGLQFGAGAPLDTNVVAPVFEPSDGGYPLGFDGDEKLFLYSSNYDDATFVDGQFPQPVTPKPLYQWYACWTYYASYYYQTLAWVTEGEPQNPTCQAVNVTRVFV